MIRNGVTVLSWRNTGRFYPIPIEGDRHGKPDSHLDALKGRPLEEVLQAVADQQATLVVRLRDGKEVVIEPKRHLKPLPEMEGRVPANWKDGVYARS